MANDVLKSAEALRDAIAKDLAAHRAEVQSLELQLAQADAFVEQVKGNRPAPASASVVRNPSRQDVTEAVLQILAEAGKPMKLQPIHDRLTAKGLTLNGRDPAGVLSTMLWRGGQDGTLVNLKGAGYWDAKKPYPAAGYTPGRR